MDRNELIGVVKQQIGNAETEQAIHLLLGFFQKAGSAYRAFYNETLQIQSQFTKTQKDEAQGTITFENAKLSYNQVNKMVLHLIDQLEHNKSLGKASKSNAWLFPSVGIALILLLAWLGLANLFQWIPSNPPAYSLPPKVSCPPFDGSSSFNILVLPFKTFDDNKLKPHLAISGRLARQSERFNIRTDVKVLDLDVNDPNSFPHDGNDAAVIGQDCNAQLVIWGTSEKSTGDQTIIQLHFKFLLGERHAQEFKKISLDETTRVDTISSVSSIATEGFLTSSIEKSLRLLFGVVANEVGNPQAAIEVLEDYDPEDESSEILQNLVLADSYLATDKEQEALEVYDKVLEHDPELGVARNNRGIIRFKNGQYAESAEDLTIALEESPQDTQALKIRGTAYLKAERLNKAKEDLQKVKALNPKDSIVSEQLEIIDNKVQATLAADKAAGKNLANNPNDISAIRDRFKSNLKLGNYKMAIKYAKKLLKQEAHLDEAYATIIAAYIGLKQTKKAKEILLNAIKKGISSKTLIDYAPEIKTLIKDLQSQESTALNVSH